MTKELLAEKLFDEACKAQWRREHPKQSPYDADPRKIGCEFKDLWPAPKDNYLAMAGYVLSNFDEKPNT